MGWLRKNRFAWYRICPLQKRVSRLDHLAEIFIARQHDSRACGLDIATLNLVFNFRNLIANRLFLLCRLSSVRRLAFILRLMDSNCV